jgi:hypothetical protein
MSEKLSMFNTVITEKGNKRYSKGVRLTTITLVFSIVLMMANKFITIEKVPTKVQVVNVNKIQLNNSKE